MAQRTPPLPFPGDWQQQKEQLLDEACQLWQTEFQRDDGRELAPSEIFPDAPRLFRRELAKRIEAIKAFSKLLNRVTTELPSEDYSIIKDISEGGQGTVVLAKDHRLGREVAIKIAHSQIPSAGEKHHLLEEATFMSNLEHPGVIPVFGLQVDEQQHPFMVMRYVPHRQNTFADKIDHAHATASKSNRSQNLRPRLREFVKVCETIQYAHDKNVLHRDIKPTNILVGDYGEVFVVDFGIARSVGDQEGKIQPAGTPAYMSPEQTEPDSAIDYRTDVYGLGATLYHLLTGQPPFMATASTRFRLAKTEEYTPATAESTSDDAEPKLSNSGSIIDLVRTGRKLKPRDVQPTTPRPLEAICLKAMHVRPEDRYATAGEIALEIDRWLDDKPVDAYPDPWYETTRRWMKQHQALVSSAIAAMFVLILVSTIAAILIDGARRQEKSAKEALVRANKELRRPRYTSQFELANALYEAVNFAEAHRVLDSTDTDLRGIEWHQLKQSMVLPKQIHDVHPGNPISLSPDFSLVAATSSYPVSANVRIVDTATGDEIWRQGLSANRVNAVRFDADGKRVAVLLQSMSDFLRMPTIMPFAPNAEEKRKAFDKQLKETQKVYVFDARTGEDLGSLERDEFDKEFAEPTVIYSARTLTSSPEMKIQINGRELSEATLLEFPNENHQLFVPHPSPLTNAAITPMGNITATAHADAGIRLWTKTEQQIARMPANSANILRMGFASRSGRLVWMGTIPAFELNGTPKTLPGFAVWSCEIPQRRVQRISPPEKWPSNQLHTGPAQTGDALHVVRSSDGTTFAAMQMGGSISIWETVTAELRCEISIDLPAIFEFDMTLSPDGSLLAVSGPIKLRSPEQPISVRPSDRKIRVFDTSTGEQLHSLPNLTHPITFHPGTDELIALDRTNKTLVVVPARGGESVASYELDPKPLFVPPDQLHQQLTNDLVAPDSQANLPRLLAFDAVRRNIIMKPAAASGRIDIIECDTETKRTVVPDDDWSTYGSINRISCTRDGSLFIAVYDNFAQIRETASWRVIAVLQRTGITDVSLSPDQSRIVTSSSDGNVDLWDAQTGAHLWTFRDLDVAPLRTWFVTFGRDNLEILAGSANGIASWNASFIDTSVKKERSTAETLTEATREDSRAVSSKPRKDAVKDERERKTFSANLTLDISDVFAAHESQDGTKLAIAEVRNRSEDWDWHVTVYDKDSGQAILEKQGSGKVQALRFDSKNTRLAIIVQPFDDKREKIAWHLRRAFIGGPVDGAFEYGQSVDVPAGAEINVWNIDSGEPTTVPQKQQFAEEFLQPSVPGAPET